jgi:hypothetical protein
MRLLIKNKEIQIWKDWMNTYTDKTWLNLVKKKDTKVKTVCMRGYGRNTWAYWRATTHGKAFLTVLEAVDLRTTVYSKEGDVG